MQYAQLIGGRGLLKLDRLTVEQVGFLALCEQMIEFFALCQQLIADWRARAAGMALVTVAASAAKSGAGLPSASRLHRVLTSA